MNKSVLSNLDHLSSLSIDEIEQAISTLPIMVQNHIMDETDADKLRYKLMTAKDKKILETYPIRMWQTKDGTWKAHVPDATKDRNRRILQGKTKSMLLIHRISQSPQRLILKLFSKSTLIFLICN